MGRIFGAILEGLWAMFVAFLKLINPFRDGGEWR